MSEQTRDEIIQEIADTLNHTGVALLPGEVYLNDLSKLVQKVDYPISLGHCEIMGWHATADKPIRHLHLVRQPRRTQP